VPVRGVSVEDLHDIALGLAGEARDREGTLLIRGLGHYAGRFIHIDVRPTVKLARWEGT